MSCVRRFLLSVANDELRTFDPYLK